MIKALLPFPDLLGHGGSQQATYRHLGVATDSVWPAQSRLVAILGDRYHGQA